MVVKVLREPSGYLNQWRLSEIPLGPPTKEVDMFARKVSMQLKSTVAEFTQTLEKEVIPLLRKQKGFRDEITLVAPGGKQVFGISLWDQAENAEASNRGPYPKGTNALPNLLTATPQLLTN